MNMILHTVVISFVFSQLVHSATTAQCYWPDGTTAESTVKPCANNKGTCCFNSDLCYSNGMCQSSAYGMPYRGACTDSSWSSSSGCAQQCTLGTHNLGIRLFSEEVSLLTLHPLVQSTQPSLSDFLYAIMARCVVETRTTRRLVVAMGRALHGMAQRCSTSHLYKQTQQASHQVPRPQPRPLL